MTEYQPARLSSIRCRPNCERAVVFIHGFSGDRNDTWDRMPGLLGTLVTDWDIHLLGYSTTLHPDIFGVWSADPDLPTLAVALTTQASIEPLIRYKSLALVGHSMGGLIVQRALIDDTILAHRTDEVFLFGTPSGGLRKARWLAFWKRQIRNMAIGSDFISTLRREWAEQFEPEPRFNLVVVAGDEDRFAPATSSLDPFPSRFRRVVPGNHRSMVLPADTDSASVRLLASVLGDLPIAGDTSAPLTLAAELADSKASDLIAAREDGMSQQDIVYAALALERNGNRDQAMALLQRFQDLGTDLQGTLAGRIKRIWLESEDLSFAEHALTLYKGALDVALAAGEVEQVYYHAINIAFLEFVAFDRPEQADDMANLALRNASLAVPNAWSVATQAEANLYLGRTDRAINLYKRTLIFEAEPWQYASTALQAGQIASKLHDYDLAERIEEIFTPVI